ncbi:DUF6011 domain-containing protein [Actinomadura bangladeshensis]|uniref:SWIM-type domain-containing protein n=1 Tax=Actinomadura bangladeshensis TaxID=453573 RepID=A0A6L9QB17_9ACTN|nr:DUF6011 domain-containing protein [Actinomadura bangladeshensis]NEA22670.1 hypothetical protein [Actinomadura bangladeshensis]
MAKRTTTKTANCLGCHSLLTAERSVRRGYGDRCWAKKRREDAARTAGFKPATIAKAKELIAEGAILPLRGRRVFRVVASNGIDRYLTAVNTCNCPAGLRGRHACYHRAAAAMLAA